MTFTTRVPPSVVARLSRDAAAALADTEVRQRLENLGFVPIASAPDEFRAMIRAEHARWSGIITEAGLKLKQFRDQLRA